MLNSFKNTPDKSKDLFIITFFYYLKADVFELSTFSRGTALPTIFYLYKNKTKQYKNINMGLFLIQLRVYWCLNAYNKRNEYKSTIVGLSRYKKVCQSMLLEAAFCKEHRSVIHSGYKSKTW